MIKYSDEIICPYCGERVDDSEEDLEVICEKCGGHYSVAVQIEVTYAINYNPLAKECSWQVQHNGVIYDAKCGFVSSVPPKEWQRCPKCEGGICEKKG